MLGAIERILQTGPAAPVGHLDAWRAQHEQLGRQLSDPLVRAVVGGAHADRLGYAFASGYQAALCVLLKQNTIPLTALAATESSGAHPRAIRTTLEAAKLVGEKTFVTFGTEAERIVVIARRGTQSDGRPELVALNLESSKAGVQVTRLPDAPFVPEIPHGSVQLDLAGADAEILPGDGYLDYLKPFRSIEDLFVFSAVLAHVLSLVGSARPALSEEIASVLMTADALRNSDFLAPGCHVALAGLLARATHLIETFESDPDLLAEEQKKRWYRDRPLFQVAATARKKRAEAAWAKLLREAT